MKGREMSKINTFREYLYMYVTAETDNDKRRAAAELAKHFPYIGAPR